MMLIRELVLVPKPAGKPGFARGHGLPLLPGYGPAPRMNNAPSPNFSTTGLCEAELLII